MGNLFHYKTQKQPILRHLSLFPMNLKFKVNLAEVSLIMLNFVVEQRHLSIFPMYLKFQVNLAEVSLRRMENNLVKK